MDAIVALLMQWLTDHTEFDTSGIAPPHVIELDAEALTLEAYGEATDALPDDGVDERIFALYAKDDGPNGTVYLLDDPALLEQDEALPPDDELPASMVLRYERLLHELVHHVQFQSGETERWACPRQGELAAYRVGARYLAAHGVPDPLPNRDWLARLYSRC